MPPNPHNLRPAQVAARLGISDSTVRRRAEAGLLPHKRVGRHYRFSAAEIDAAQGGPQVDRAEIRRLVRLELRLALAELGAQEGEERT